MTQPFWIDWSKHMRRLPDYGATDGSELVPIIRSGGNEYIGKVPLSGLTGFVGGLALFEDNAAAEASTAVPSGALLTGSRDLAGDPGGAVYFKEDEEPDHALKINIGSSIFGFRARTITPEIALADGTGSAFSDDAFENLVDYTNQFEANDGAGRGLLIRAIGRYKLAEEHQFTVSKLTWDFEGRGLLDLSASSTDADFAALHFLHASGPDGQRTTVPGTVQVGDTTITVASSTGFTAGDAIALTSTGEYWNGIEDASGYAPSNKAELLEIESISGNVITLAGPTRDSYLGGTYTTYFRKLNLIGDITLRDFRALGVGGGTDHTSSIPLGMRAIDADFVTRFRVDGAQFENFPRFAMRSVVGFDHMMSNSVIIGRKLSDSTNLPNVSPWFTGWAPTGIQGVEVTACHARHARRLVDPDASPGSTFDDDDDQQIPSRDIHITGGTSYDCVTGPAGHKYQGLNVKGHIVRGCDTGIQHRGKDLVVTGVDIIAGTAIVIGVGTPDPTIYTEDPSSGTVHITGSRLTGTNYGIYAPISWDQLVIASSRIAAPIAFTAFGKRNATVDISDCKFINSDAASPVIASTYASKLDASNWRVKDTLVQGGTYGFDLSGSDAFSVTDLIFDSVTFKSIGTRPIRLGATGSPLWGAGIIVRNCISGFTGTGIATTGSAAVVETENDWTPLFGSTRVFTIASGVITLPAYLPFGVPYYINVDVESGSTDNLTTINGGVPGCVIVMTAVSDARDIVVKDGSDNIRCGSDITLDNIFDTVIMMKAQSGDWIRLSNANNGA